MMARSVYQLVLTKSNSRHTVREQLEWNDVDETLQAIGSLGDSDHLGLVGNGIIVLVTDDD